MNADILQIMMTGIHILILIGLIYGIYILVRNSERSANALENIAKNLGERVEKK